MHDTLIEEVEATRWAAHLVDENWTLVWVSSELKALLGTEDEEELGVGRHLLEAQLRPAWRRAISVATELEQLQLQVPAMIGPAGETREVVRRILPGALHEWLDQADPAPVPEARASEIEFLQGDLPAVKVRVLDIRLDTEVGPSGVLRLYGSALPARLLALVGRGDEGMFERMARAFEPGERGAAILFADVEASGALARRISSERFFSLIRELTTRVDAAVIKRRGLVGKHAGDGVTAFFLEEDLGSASAAAEAAIDAARALEEIAGEISRRRADELEGQACELNIGLHWGARLFIGQVVTGGRIEVTALGDEVNRGARLEQAATHGQVLASRELVERLDAEATRSLGIDTRTGEFRALREFAGVSDKVRRDAGDLEVLSL